jgi:dimethylaniline monooxygenase (N-oxide forming)
LGLVAVKNLTEQGLDVTAFEQGDDVGGIWYPREGQLSVLPGTVGNHTKQNVSCIYPPADPILNLA